jgi:outer membrane protein assembly factor BamB
VDGYFYALNSDGTLRWRLRTGSITESSPVIGADGTLYVGANRDLSAINRDGTLKWSRGNEDLVDSTPLAIDDGSVWYNSRFGKLTCLSSAKQYGGENFLGTEFGVASPAIGPSGTIYSRGWYSKFYALQTHVPLAKTAWPKFRANAANTGVVNEPTP